MLVDMPRVNRYTRDPHTLFMLCPWFALCCTSVRLHALYKDCMFIVGPVGGSPGEFLVGVSGSILQNPVILWYPFAELVSNIHSHSFRAELVSRPFSDFSDQND